MLPFAIQFRPGLPVSEQLVYAVHKALVTGQMKPGDPFPSVRQLSKELKINPNTAHKVVALLKQDGLLEVEPGRGTFISQNHVPSEADRGALLEGKIEALVVEAKKLEIPKETVQEAIDRHWDRF
ncbi:GntR family transcriptional regulator [soil metagenome]